MTTSRRSSILLVLPLIAGAALACGCSATQIFHREKLVRAKAENPAAEIISLWQPAKGPGLNQVPTRGMAGQVMFFTRGSASPAVVEGDVRVYLFDNQGTPEEQAKPIWQFDFPAADWQNFARMGSLGPSYNVFIPYVRETPKQVECAIQIRFTPKDGPVVFSEMTTMTLPGAIDPDEEGFLPSKPANVPPSMGANPPALLPAPTSASPASPKLSVQTIRPGAANAIQQASHQTTHDEEASRTESTRAPRTASHVVPAHYEDGAPSRDARIEELEEMVRELRHERSRQARTTTSVSERLPATRTTHPITHDSIEDAAAPPRRYRAKGTTVRPAPAATSDDASDGWSGTSAEPRGDDFVPADSPAPQPIRLRTRHPLGLDDRSDDE